MKPLKIHDILKATDGKLLFGNDSHEITSICTDSRHIEKNSLFIPLVGENFDGHKFILDAIKSGSRAVLVNADKVESLKDNDFCDVSVIKVLDTLRAFGKIAEYYRSLFKIPCVGITGSVGKTTTKEMTFEVLSQKYNVLKNEGNFNNEIGVPLTVLRLLDEHELLISEMGMSGFSEIDRLSSIVKPDIAMITNIGMSHIELLGSQENIYKAKSEIISNTNPKGIVILNGDDKILMSHIGEITQKVITVAIENKDSDVVAEIIKSDAESIEFKVSGLGESFDCKLSVPGEHNVYDALFALAAGHCLGVEKEKILCALSQFKPAKMRQNTIVTDNYTIINDCYNAAPDSMRASLKVLGAKQGRKVAVLGDIACLGEYSYDAHKEVGSQVALNNIDILITIGKEARLIGEGAFLGGMDSVRIFSFDDVDSALLKLLNIVSKGDTILVKASRVMQLEKVVEFLTK